MVGIVEALEALQAKLDARITFDDKKAIIQDLVAGIIIETRKDDVGERYPLARVTYRFEKPSEEPPIPAELVAPFAEAAE